MQRVKQLFGGMHYIRRGNTGNTNKQDLKGIIKDYTVENEVRKYTPHHL